MSKSHYICAMKIKLKTGPTVINNYIDPETAELLDVSVDIKTHTIVVDSKDQFAFVYSNVIGALKGLNGTDIKLLIHCSQHCIYNTNVVSLNKYFLEGIAKTYDTSVGSLKNSIIRLVQKSVLIKMGSGTYRVNPRYFWRGESNERLTTMKFILEVECPHC